MAQDDWYRNTTWSAATEASFRDKLSRSRRSRPQYLRIQAACLADEYPQAALGLIDQYFETGDEFDMAMALCARARAYVSLGNIEEAVATYRRALGWEISHPNHLSLARTEFPRLVAEKRLATEYDYAIDILGSRFGPFDHQFPITRYEWNGANALIASERGLTTEAKEFAERALRAAAQSQSPFRQHSRVGLVDDTSDEFGQRIRRLARPSFFHRLISLVMPAR